MFDDVPNQGRGSGALYLASGYWAGVLDIGPSMVLDDRTWFQAAPLSEVTALQSVGEHTILSAGRRSRGGTHVCVYATDLRTASDEPDPDYFDQDLTYPVTVDRTSTLAVTTDTWVATNYTDSQVSSTELKSEPTTQGRPRRVPTRNSTCRRSRASTSPTPTSPCTPTTPRRVRRRARVRSCGGSPRRTPAPER